MLPARQRHTAFALFFLLAVLAPSTLFAACSNPTGTAGDVIYNGSYNQLQFCNGTNWVNAGSSGTISGIGTLTSGDFCTTDGSVINCTTGTISLTTQVSGTLQAAQMAALTGDVTNSAGSLATTVGKINGVALGSTTATAANLLIGSGTQWVSNAVTGDVTIGSGGVTAIGSGKVTNGMLAGSIAASKLVGTDIATVGTITGGVWNAGAVTSSGTLTGTGLIASGNAGIGTTSVASTAVLDLVSTTKGLLPPRITTAQRDAISSPATGLTIYNSTTNAMNIYNGTAWGAVGGGALSGLSDVTLSGTANNDILRYNGSAWVNVPINTAMTTTTMMANFPDAINCKWNNSGTYQNWYFLHGIEGSGNLQYYYGFPGSGAFNRIVFNSNGTWSSTDYGGTLDCASQSISWFYTNGRAFNFIGTGAVTTFDAGTVSAPGLAVTSDTDTGLYEATANALSITAGGKEAARFEYAASGVNYVDVTGAATGAGPIAAAAGTDTNIDLNINAKGTGTIKVTSQAAGAVAATIKAAASQTGDLLDFQNSSGTVLSLVDSGGSVGIGTTAVSSKAVLDMVSTTKGFLPPRMTTTQRDAISSPATGLTIYNSTTNAMNIYNGSSWGAVGGGALSGLSDVTLSGTTSGQYLSYNGSAWVNTTGAPGSAGPSFYVHKNGTNQTVSATTWTKLTWSTEVFDTNNNFASDKFTPTVAGKYIFTLNLAGDGVATIAAIYKNGSIVNQQYGGSNYGAVTVILDMNGSTDYVEAYGWINQGSLIYGATSFSGFYGSMLAPLATGVVAGTGSAGYVPYWTSGNAITYDSTSGGQFYWDGINHRLGIGTTSPSYRLEVNGTSQIDGTLNFKSTGVLGNFSIADNGGGTATLNNSGNSYLVLTGSNVGIGSTSPAVALDVVGAGAFTTSVTGARFIATGSTIATNGMYLPASNKVGFATNSTAAMVIDASQNVGIGTTNPAAGTKLNVISNSGYAIWGDNSGAASVGVYGRATGSGASYGMIAHYGGSDVSAWGLYCIGGTGACGGDHGWSISSDARLKTAIQDLPAESGLASILKLRPVTFHWRDSPRDAAEGEQIGFIAQETEKIYPSLVHTGGFGIIRHTDGTEEKVKNMKTVVYETLVAPLVKAVQELNAIFDTLAARVDKLYAMVTGHDEAIKKLEAEKASLRKDLNDLRKAFDAFTGARRPRVDKEHADTGMLRAANDNHPADFFKKASGDSAWAKRKE